MTRAKRRVRSTLSTLKATNPPNQLLKYLDDRDGDQKEIHAIPQPVVAAVEEHNRAVRQNPQSQLQQEEGIEDHFENVE